MKTLPSTLKSNCAGSALALTLVLTGLGLTILAGAMTWSMNATKLTQRSIEYSLATAAAEAATEKAVSKFAYDFQNGGAAAVQANLASYQVAVPTASDSPYWSNWVFDDGTGQTGRSFVQGSNSTSYVVLNSAYAGLRGFVFTQTVVSHALNSAAREKVVAGVLQQLQLASIPIFQFAMYSSGDMEISCGQPFSITGQVHANKNLYVEPDSALTFKSDVTAVGNILFARHPLDTRGAVAGTGVYEAAKTAGVGAMNLPIGTNNEPAAISEILQMPSVGEDPNSSIGKVRYYNQADMILTVTDLGITATSGRFNNFATQVLAADLATFVNVTTNSSFTDAREGKPVRSIDIDIKKLKDWSATGSSLYLALGSAPVASIYVVDQRTLPATQLGAVRVKNGKDLPTRGLTVATARPLYVQGHFNQPNAAKLGTADTTDTQPASLVGDAVSILSENWNDSNSTAGLSSRTAAPTTVNAAILTGVVETTLGKYSGGMENFPRFLENWGAANPFTYNGSMVRMFSSRYATNSWGTSGVYNPPQRNWTYDLNFNDATKLPPLTPTLRKVIRSEWSTVAPNSNVAASK